MVMRAYEGIKLFVCTVNKNVAKNAVESSTFSKMILICCLITIFYMNLQWHTNIIFFRNPIEMSIRR